MTFSAFDPLEHRSTTTSEAAFSALRREISNILSSYVGWYDPFCELIQNALDAVEARARYESANGGGSAFQPAISVLVDVDGNSLTVSDNGIGLDKEQFQQFLAPSFSFKSGKTRGHKGVGATYVAYGFNYMRVSTKAPGFQASGQIRNARKWLSEDTTGVNPKVEPDSTEHPDPDFEAVDRGVSVTVRFDSETHPKQLSWLQAADADTWQKILYIKTGLGSVAPDETVKVSIKVKNKGVITEAHSVGTSYQWLHSSASKVMEYSTLISAQNAHFDKYRNLKLPDKYKNLDFVYASWDAEKLRIELGSELDADALELIARHSPSVSFEFAYTAKMWTQFNESLGVRSKVLSPGIQLAANNMPQGETILVPLTRNIGRQQQVHFLIHFDNYTPDLGRKGFHRELTEFAKDVAKAIVDNVFPKIRGSLKMNTGASPDLMRNIALNEWKAQITEHEKNQPLTLKSKHFFRPVDRVSITSAPTREQDVIALFNQLIAGGVIRGLNMMSTNERFTYDGLFRVAFDLDQSVYVFDAESNPLGVSADAAKALSGKVTEPQILEYKFSLDGLVEDFDTQDKNIKDVDLCVAWETGTSYKGKYGIVSLLIPENADQREYHGVTHRLVDPDSGSRLCDVIILGELVAHLNDRVASADLQRAKYE